MRGLSSEDAHHLKHLAILPVITWQLPSTHTPFLLLSCIAGPQYCSFSFSAIHACICTILHPPWGGLRTCLLLVFAGHTRHQQSEAVYPAGRDEPLRFVQVLLVSEELWERRRPLEDCESGTRRDARSQKCNNCPWGVYERVICGLIPFHFI